MQRRREDCRLSLPLRRLLHSSARVLEPDAVHLPDQPAEAVELVDVVESGPAGIGVDRLERDRPDRAEPEVPVSLKGPEGIPDEGEVRIEARAAAQRGDVVAFRGPGFQRLDVLTPGEMPFEGRDQFPAASSSSRASPEVTSPAAQTTAPRKIAKSLSASHCSAWSRE